MDKKDIDAILFFQGSSMGSIVHPFLKMEVMEFSKFFKTVYVICQESPHLLDEFKDIDNCKIITFSRNDLKFSFFRFSKLSIKYLFYDVVMAFKNKILNYRYFIETIKILAYGLTIYDCANKLIMKTSNRKYIVESYWLSGSAYAASLIKIKYGNIKVISRAHSSEIDIKRNPYCICQMKKFINEKIDKIFFVTEWGLDQYINNIMPLYGVEPVASECLYLGTKKMYDLTNTGSYDDIFRIVTCSRIVKLKRLDLLLKALEKGRFSKKIVWTHIGDGDNLEFYQNTVMTNNVILNFLGNINNDDVHKFLMRNPVDLFVNISEFEGLPVSIMEAMSYGIPILATDVGGVKEIVSEKNGILLNSNPTIDDIINAINHFINLDKDRILMLGKSSLEKWNSVCNKEKNYNTFFREIINLVEKDMCFNEK